MLRYMPKPAEKGRRVGMFRLAGMFVFAVVGFVVLAVIYSFAKEELHDDRY